MTLQEELSEAYASGTEEFNAYAYHLYRYGPSVAMAEWDEACGLTSGYAEQGFPNDTIRLRDELEVTGDPKDTWAIRRDSHGVVARNNQPSIESGFDPGSLGRSES